MANTSRVEEILTSQIKNTPYTTKPMSRIEELLMATSQQIDEMEGDIDHLDPDDDFDDADMDDIFSEISRDND